MGSRCLWENTKNPAGLDSWVGSEAAPCRALPHPPLVAGTGRGHAHPRTLAAVGW